MNDPRHLWVDVDGWSGVHQATEHLLGTGIRHIAYLGWPSPSGTGDDRRRGWREAMVTRSHLSELELDALAMVAEDGVGNGRAAVEALRATGTPVEAIVCASDSLALGAALAVGADIPVIGYDNTPVAEAVGLSSVEQPLDEVAAGVLELLMGPTGADVLDRDAAAGVPRHRLVTPRLVVRERSTLL